MGRPTKRPRPGDVFELRTPDGYAYVQYLGKHPKYGDALLVGPDLHQERAPVVREAFAGGYVTFYPLTVAVTQELVEWVGHFPPPVVPRRLRRAGKRSARRVETWVIEDDNGQAVTAKLSQEDLRLPIAAIWNHEFLIQRLRERWHPSQEGVDA